MNKPKAIVFYTYLPPWRIDVFNEMAKMYSLTIVFLYADAEGFTYNRSLLLGKLKNVETIFWNKGFMFKGKAFRFGLAGLIRKYKPEVVFAHEYAPSTIFLATLKKFGVFSFRLVITTSDNLQMAKGVDGIKALFRNYVLKTSDRLIVYSEQVRHWYQSSFSILPVAVCPNIQNPKSLLGHRGLIPVTVNQHKQVYNLKDRVILYVGRLEYIKGLDLLIQAFAASNCRGTHQLVMVGTGAYKESLQQQAVDLGIADKVLFPGYFESTSLYAWYTMADFFVLPSRYEPFGAVVNEALVFGCPVLASVHIGALDYIKEGQNGYIFNPEIIAQFIAKLDETAKLANRFITSNRADLMPVSFETYMAAFQLNN